MVGLYQAAWKAKAGVLIAADLFRVGDIKALAIHLETLVRHIFLSAVTESANKTSEFAFNWCALFNMKHSIVQEIKKRGSSQVGFPAGTYLLLSELDQRSGSLGLLDPAITNSLNEFVQKLPRLGTTAQIIGKREFNYESREMTRHSINGEIKSKAAETLASRWNDDGFSLLCDAIDGRLNIAPRAVSDDLTNDLDRSRRREEIFVELRESDSDDAPREESLQKVHEKKAAEEWCQSVQGTSRLSRLKEWAKNDPRFTRYIELRLQGFKKKEIARMLGVSPRTLSNWDKKMREALS
jgi:hypothetical protein